MEHHSTTAKSRSPFSEGPGTSTVSKAPIHHTPLPSEDFMHIAFQANAAADDLMNSFSGASNSQRLSPDRINSAQHPRLASIGILDLEKEGAFHVESDCEQDFMKMALDSFSESEFNKWSPTSNHTDHSSSPAGIPSQSNFFRLPDQGKQSLERTGQSSQSKGGLISCSLSGGSMDATSLSLELQSALRVAELEVSQLQAQVCSKTQHLEMAQRALVDYEDEVQTLRKQLKVLTEDESEFDHASIQSGLQSHERKLSHENIVKDLWRVKSGTHRIRLSLGEVSDEAGPCKQQDLEILKDNYERLNIQNKELEVGNETLKTELEGISLELQSALRKVGQYEERMEALTEENRSLVKEKTKLKTQLIQAQEELMCVLSETPDADEEVSTYRQRLKESQEQREKLHRDLECARAELAKFKSGMSEQQILEPKRDLTEEERIERANEERVLQLRVNKI